MRSEFARLEVTGCGGDDVRMNRVSDANKPTDTFWQNVGSEQRGRILGDCGAKRRCGTPALIGLQMFGLGLVHHRV